MIELLLALAPLAQPTVHAPGDDALGTWMCAPLVDGERAAVPCADGTVRLFALATGATEAVLPGHTGPVLAVIPGPEGTWLVSCGKDLTIRLWNLAEGEVHAVLEATREVHPYWGHTLAFSPAGEHLVAVGYEGWARVWDVASAEPLLTLPAEHRTSAATWTPDGRLLAVGRDGFARVWDVVRGEETRAPLEHEGAVEVVACHPDGKRIATAGSGITTWIWDLETGEPLGETRQGSDPLGTQSIDQLHFSADGTDLFVTSGGCWNVFALDAVTLKRRWWIDNGGGTSAPIRVTLDHAGERVALSTMSRIVSRADGADVVELPGGLGPFRFSPDDRYVLADGRNAAVVLDGETLEVLYRRIEHADGKCTIQRD